MAALVADLRGDMERFEFSPPCSMQENSEHSLNGANPPVAKSHSIFDEDLVPLVNLARAQGREVAYAVLCGALADAMDHKPTGQVQQLPLYDLPPEAILHVLSHVKDLNKATTVRAPIVLLSCCLACPHSIVWRISS